MPVHKILYFIYNVWKWFQVTNFHLFSRNIKMKFLGKTIMFYKSRTSLVDFPGGSDGKASAYNAGETWVRFLGQEDPLEKAMAPHSSTLAWKIPWTEEHDRVQSMGSQRVGHDWAPSLSLSTRLLSLIIISLPEILNCYPWKIAWRYRWVAAKRSVSQCWISFFTVILHRIPEYETDQKACWLESLAAAAQ